jgi:hypothetical protein
MFSLSYAKFYKIGLYAECHYAECIYAKCHSAILCQEARLLFFLFLSLTGAETLSINNTKPNDTLHIGLRSDVALITLGILCHYAVVIRFVLNSPFVINLAILSCILFEKKKVLNLSIFSQKFPSAFNPKNCANSESITF